MSNRLSLNQLKAAFPEAHAAFVKMEDDAWNIQCGDPRIDPDEPLFELDQPLDGEVYFNNPHSIYDFAFKKGEWTC